MSAGAALDILVIGSGVAGLTAVLRAQAGKPDLRVGVIAKSELSASATAWAQGGVAAVLGDDEVTYQAGGAGDSAALHMADTLAAGAGLCDVAAVEVLIGSGPDCVRHLVSLGASFDRDGAGVLELAREGGHSAARVVHAGGAATGAEVQRALVVAVRASDTIIWENCFAIDLIIDGGRCRGAQVLLADGAGAEIRAGETILATGGAGQLFSVTTNPETSTGDGLAMALRAGVAVADVEFVQFHPTALHHPVMPRPLLSEALRGEGALLVDHQGRRFVDELAPRDVVSRAMTQRMLADGVEHLWLDARGVADLEERFATLVTAISAAGLDPVRERLPVAPAAHYLCGGVLTDLDGATSLPGLWAAGEVACTGVHGANRLASNSLLEGLVFAARAVDAIGRAQSGPTITGALGTFLSGHPDARGIVAACLPPFSSSPPTPSPEPAPITARRRSELQRAMSVGAGVVRSAGSLDQTRQVLAALSAPFASATAGRADHEIGNLVTVAHALLAAATARQESRGCHSRTEFPEPSPAWLRRLVL